MKKYKLANNVILLRNKNWSINIKVSQNYACCEINNDMIYCHKGHTVLNQFMYLKETVLKLYNKDLCAENLRSYGINEDSFNYAIDCTMKYAAETLQDAYEFDCSTGYSRAFDDGYYVHSRVTSGGEARGLLNKISIPFSLLEQTKEATPMEQYAVFCYDSIFQQTFRIGGLFDSSKEAEEFAEKQRKTNPLYSYYVEPAPYFEPVYIW